MESRRKKRKRGREKGGDGEEESGEWRERGGEDKREKPLPPSVSTSRPPSAAGLSLLPLSAFLFSLFPFCLAFFGIIVIRGTFFTHSHLSVSSNLGAKSTFDAVEASWGRRGDAFTDGHEMSAPTKRVLIFNFDFTSLVSLHIKCCKCNCFNLKVQYFCLYIEESPNMTCFSCWVWSGEVWWEQKSVDCSGVWL